MKYTLTIALVLCTQLVQANPKVVYGEDNRSEPFQKPEYFGYSRGVMVQIRDDKLTLFDGVEYLINTKNHGETYNLCEGEKFFDQPQVGNCSGFLVAPDTIITAGHCMTSQADCDGAKWAIGYEVSETNGNPKSLRKEDVYSCKTILHTSRGNADYAVIKLDRDTNGVPLSLLPEGQNANAGDDLVMIGFPSLLPMKITDGAKVLSVKPDGNLITNLDAFGGNSGSLVLNAKTGQAVGILVAGKTDYDYRGSCKIVYILPMTDGGEVVTTIKKVPRDF